VEIAFRTTLKLKENVAPVIGDLIPLANKITLEVGSYESALSILDELFALIRIEGRDGGIMRKYPNLSRCE